MNGFDGLTDTLNSKWVPGFGTCKNSALRRLSENFRAGCAIPMHILHDAIHACVVEENENGDVSR